jgi:hypothetical protein
MATLLSDSSFTYIGQFYENGCKDIAIEVSEYYGLKKWPEKASQIKEDIEKFENYLANSGKSSLFIHVFTPDRKYVLTDLNIKRNDPLLVKCVEMNGDWSFGSHAELKVVNIPDGVEFEIDDYDGMETIHEAHRSWG